MARFDSITKILHGRRMPQIYDPNISVGQVILNVMFKNKNKVIQINDDDGVEVTCSQMASMMTNIAKNLYRLGFRSGDVAGLFASHTTYVAPAIFGCLLIRLPVNPIEKSFDVNQIVNIFRETNPKVVFCDNNVVDKLMVALGILESEATIVILTDRIEGFVHITDLIVDCNVSEDFIFKSTDEKNSFIVCTSGSSGNQKLALVTHLQQLQSYIWTNDYDADSFDLNMTSYFWLVGLNNLIFRTLHVQKRLITAKPFTPDLFIDLIEKYEINVCFLITSYLCLLTESPRFWTADFSRLKYLKTGGIYVSETLRQIVKDKLTNGIVIVGYGMTEFCGLLAETPHDCQLSSAVGVPSINTDVKIQLDDGTTGYLGEIGEILARNPVTFSGYYKNRHKAKFDDEGWLHTGDMGYIDEKYEINIIGQRTFAIKNVVNEIFPFDIENKICTLDGVNQAVVVGTPDSIEIEIPTALVVRDANSDVDESDILEVTSDLPAYKKIRGGIFFVDSLPTTNTGKVERKKSKELAIKLKIERESRTE